MPQKLFILAEARSGSSWLLETLNSHREITLLSELLNHAMFKEVVNFHQMPAENLNICINYLENKLVQKNNRYTGCKILLNQLEWISENFSSYFIQHYQDSNFIFLYRENMIETQISLRIAHTYKIWHTREKETIKIRKIPLNLYHLYKNLERSKSLREKILKQLEDSDVKIIQITYEELFKHKRKSIKNICRFLDISDKNILFSDEKKGIPFRPEEIIENFTEVKQFLKQYPYYYEMLGE